MAARVCLVVVWFGDLPVWMPFFLKSCSRAESLNWQIFTDADAPPNVPENVCFRMLSKSGFELLVSECFREPWHVSCGYKLCDLKPAYGDIFWKSLQEYDYWGYTDLDVLIGNPVTMLVAAGAMDADVITASRKILVGHFTLLRNTERLRQMYRECSGWRDRLRAESYAVFDEADFSDHVRGKAAKGELKLAEVPIVQEDCLIDWAGRRCFSVLWWDGHLVDLLICRRLGYFHFIRTKYLSDLVPTLPGAPAETFLLTSTGFVVPAGLSGWLRVVGLLCWQAVLTLPWYLRQLLKRIIPPSGRRVLLRVIQR